MPLQKFLKASKVLESTNTRTPISSPRSTRHESASKIHSIYKKKTLARKKGKEVKMELKCISLRKIRKKIAGKDFHFDQRI